MIYGASRGAFTTTIKPGDETPDGLEHLSEDELISAISDERYWKALHADDSLSVYVIPYGTGAYCVSVAPGGSIRTAMYEPDLDALQKQFDAALLAEEGTTTVTSGRG